jgi:hypothetical protein
MQVPNVVLPFLVAPMRAVSPAQFILLDLISKFIFGVEQNYVAHCEISPACC